MDKPPSPPHGAVMRVFWDDACLAHSPGFFLQRGQVRPNFEVAARAEVLLAACREMGLAIETPAPAPTAALEAVHDKGFLRFLETCWAEWTAMPDHGPELVPNLHPTPEMLEQGAQLGPTIIQKLGWYSADTGTPLGPDSWDAAHAAAGLAVAAADCALAGDVAYALCRPPGHHAYAARIGGHCILNNAAIAAQRMIAGGASRVAVIDIDSHHGNGTQGIFWNRPDVFFASIHGDPDGYYPWFIGRAGETGGAGAEGANLNLPLPRGAADSAWLAAIDHALAGIRDFGAEALVVSLGFDASKDEPLGWLAVTEDGFARAGAAIGAIGRPTAIVQEGGYNTRVIGTLLRRYLDGFAG